MPVPDCKRIAELLAKHQLTQSEFARAVNSTAQRINGILRGRESISTNLALKIYEAFGGDLHYLITGIKLRPLDESASTILLPPTEEDQLTFYLRPVTANPLMMHRDKFPPEEIVDFCSIARRENIEPLRLRCLRLSDDAMGPLLRKGSVVAVDPAIREWKDIEGRIVCAFAAGMNPVIRYWHDGGDYILLTAANQDHHPIALLRSRAKHAVIGAVVWARLNLAPGVRPDLMREEDSEGTADGPTDGSGGGD